MQAFSISAAARLCHCDRRTLQRAIHAGRLQLDAQHGLSRDALIAAGYLVGCLDNFSDRGGRHRFERHPIPEVFNPPGEPIHGRVPPPLVKIVHIPPD